MPEYAKPTIATTPIAAALPVMKIDLLDIFIIDSVACYPHALTRIKLQKKCNKMGVRAEHLALWAQGAGRVRDAALC